MPLIDKTYFIGEITIAQLSQPAVQASLALFIGKREPEYLLKALGYSFKKLYDAGAAETDGRWYDLINGAEYTDRRGFLKKWTGLKNAELQSPIANYTYYWYQRDNVTFTAGSGEQEGKSDNATSVSSAPKMKRAFNEMVDQTWLLHDYLLHKKDDAGVLVYDEFDIKQVSREVTEKLNDFNI